jgi:hypothetical protein
VIEYFCSWQGHSSLIPEIRDQLLEEYGVDRKPSAVISCVGGGGLAIGYDFANIVAGKHCWGFFKTQITAIYEKSS